MDLLNDLKAAGYKIVFMKPKFPSDHDRPPMTSRSSRP
jgi:hypothetical protein